MKPKISHGRFFALLKQIPYATKEELVWIHSHMRTESLSTFAELDPRGYNEMVNQMQRIVEGISERDIKKLRSSILLRLQKHGVDTTNWNAVNKFLKQPRIAGKELYLMSITEMQELIKKLESILHKDKIIQERTQRLACLN